MKSVAVRGNYNSALYRNRLHSQGCRNRVANFPFTEFSNLLDNDPANASWKLESKLYIALDPKPNETPESVSSEIII